MTIPTYENLRIFYGDFHCHCNVGYGRGSVEEAYENARTQLDFACLTAHWQWPDIPADDIRLAKYVAWHREGFKRTAELWHHLLQATEESNQEGQFVTFSSFEWHSMRFGDHNVYFKEPRGELFDAVDLEGLRAHLRRLAQQGLQCFLIPHHIGYATGYRGVNWNDFTSEFTPVVEIVSMHGLAESDDAPYPYLLPMGPRHGGGTMQRGLETGNVFGVIGSTDHHGAHPGSYGHGRVAVWARELTRDGIWDAIANRRTYALTGDRIELSFSLDGEPMGSIVPPARERQIQVSVIGGGSLDYVEVLHNNQVIHRWNPLGCDDHNLNQPIKVWFELGWGAKDRIVEWQGDLRVVNSKILSIEPRFRGPEVITMSQAQQAGHASSKWQQIGENQVQFSTLTWGNPSNLTSATQGICLEILPTPGARIEGKINGCDVQADLNDLGRSSQVSYIEGFRSPAFCFHRAVPKAEYACDFSLVHNGTGSRRDWYYVRVCQKNGQWAWSSPIWVQSSIQ